MMVDVQVGASGGGWYPGSPLGLRGAAQCVRGAAADRRAGERPPAAQTHHHRQQQRRHRAP